MATPLFMEASKCRATCLTQSGRRVDFAGGDGRPHRLGHAMMKRVCLVGPTSVRADAATRGRSGCRHVQHSPRQCFGHLDAVDAGRHDAARITRAFAGRVQAFHVQALEVAATSDAQRR